MAVPVAPAAGEPIAEAWGDVVHDAVVAMDIQSGKTNITVASNANSGNIAIVFPRPFAGVPVVVVSQAGFTGSYIVYTNGPSATGVTLATKHTAGTNAAATIPCSWIAYGARA